MTETGPSRIQSEKRAAILGAALEVFAAEGFRGATLDRIAGEAGLSKPNLLYYFPSKEEVHEALLSGLLDLWLAPLRRIDPDGEPMAELLGYVRRKLALSRSHPRESRLFANEILQGAPRIGPTLSGALRDLVEEKAQAIAAWAETGAIAPVDPRHLIISVWALTQHYADFDVQVRAVLGRDDPLDGAEAHLEMLFERLLAPRA
ncbi:TetR family transcriptional regulator [Palleronia aestuarii]|uniref:TetR family transcriptional regulator n=1 Tax=Palleronia aestuarii TaxID=568105 RepID=A0A2W7N8U5_9RHOB|nr:TetR family transcriptional regulator C-terminal domain-containing protein [Palleronia aestuarii]PZX16508.1 TetR family transcriptional regulator [Palleronia aestuarii]